MFFKFYLFQTFSQPLDNLFLTVKTIFNWNFQSTATSKVQSFVVECLREGCVNPNEVASDNDDDDDDKR